MRLETPLYILQTKLHLVVPPLHIHCHSFRQLYRLVHVLSGEVPGSAPPTLQNDIVWDLCTNTYITVMLSLCDVRRLKIGRRFYTDESVKPCSDACSWHKCSSCSLHVCITHHYTFIIHCNTSQYSPLSNVLDHQVAADVKRDFLSNFLYILIIFKKMTWVN